MAYRFDKKQEADLAIRHMNGHRLPGSSEPLVVKVSEEHGKQKAVAFMPPNFVQPLSQDYRSLGYGYEGQTRGGGPYRGERGRWTGGQGGQHDRRGGRRGAHY